MERKTIIAVSATAGVAGLLALALFFNQTPALEIAQAKSATEELTAEISTPEETVENSQTTSGSASGQFVFDEQFTKRDLQQKADLTDAESIVLKDDAIITIDTEGVYAVSGTAKNAQICVDAEDSAKVQIVLDGVNITNDDIPCIYILNCDKTFITAVSENTLTVTNEFSNDGDTKTDAVIFAKDDIVINGTGVLNILSSKNGISGKDDVKITGATLNITCSDSAIEANDSIRIADGTINILSCYDGLHAENDEDDVVGYIYIAGGNIGIQAQDDAIHGTTYVQIDGGKISASGAEAIEGTIIQINGGSIDIAATDDGINAAKKSSIATPLVEINGGDITVKMGQGDTDGIDSNGNLIINGGTISIEGQSPFDYDGTAEFNGGTLIVNGVETTQLTNQFGGGMNGGMGDMRGGGFGREDMPQDMQGGKPQDMPEMPEGEEGGMVPPHAKKDFRMPNENLENPNFSENEN